MTRTPADVPRGALVAAVALVLAAGAAAAADDRSGRYTMTPADGGFLRLDTETGAVSMCAKKDRDGQWTCEPLPDAAAAQKRDLERLEAENKALKDEIRQMEEIMGLDDKKPGEPGSTQAERPKPGFPLPTEKDVDQAFDYMQRMLKKFQEKLKELESGRKDGGGTPL
jgi:hypothetical protein